MVDLSRAGDGLRVVVVTVDATGALLSAGDTVLRRAPGAPSATHHDSIGGRFEPDGSFRGTASSSIHDGEVAGEAEDDPGFADVHPRAPAPEEVTRLRALVAEVVRRARAAAAPA